MEGIRVNWQQFVDMKTKIGKSNPIIILRTGDKKNDSPINILKRSIHRAWTINGPTDYWDTARKSTTIRIYRSLPLKRNKRKRDSENAEKNLLIQAWGTAKKISCLDTSIVNCQDDNKRKEKVSMKHGERKSNIPIFRRSLQEFEDIGYLRESSKHSPVTTIPQRYRGSADDLRRYRDDTNVPSHIPKLLNTPRPKENKLKKISAESSKDNISRLNNSCKSAIKDSTTMSSTIERDNTKIVDKLSRYKLITNETMGVEKNETIDVKIEQQQSSIINHTITRSDVENVGKSQIDDLPQRKYSKDDLSTDDIEGETRIRCPSSHLSPEASPLSTHSSRYSPRESESEPTPGLPRKTTIGDTCVSSQRVRDAITRTRRESNSSARCESSGSESIRLSESGLHDYTDLARRVRLFGNNYYCPRTTSVESDEPVPRDSATSAGEDEAHENCLLRDPLRYPSASSSSSSQGRTILRRRRQFDSQGNK